jgi:hypothetical protein
MYHMQVTTALLADAAQVANGKLYIHGAGWDTIHAAAFPTTHPTFALALVFRVEYSEALVNIPIRIALVDDDENDAGIQADVTLNVGHPAGMTAGTPMFIPQAMTVNMMQFVKPGQFRFRISSGGTELASIPFRLAPLPAGLQSLPPPSPSLM